MYFISKDAGLSAFSPYTLYYIQAFTYPPPTVWFPYESQHNVKIVDIFRAFSLIYRKFSLYLQPI